MAANPITITLVDGITKGLKDISVGVNGLGAQFVKLNAGIELVQQSFGLIVDAAKGLADATAPARNFEDSLAKIQAQTGATAEEMDLLKKAALEATEATRFGADEAGQALFALSEDGVNTTAAMEQLGTVLAFAQANAQGAAEAAQGLGGVLDGFGEAPESIGKLADSLSAVSRAAGTSTKSLQEGLAAVGAQATTANVSIEDATAALGVFATAGKDGGQAAALLGRLVTELNDPAKKAGAAIRELGLSTGDFSGLVRSLRGDSEVASTVLESLSTRGRLAMSILLREGGASVDQFKLTINEAAGATKAASDIVGSTFNGALAKLTNAFEQAKIVLFAPLLEPLRLEIEQAAAEIAAFAKTQEFAELSQRIKEFVEISVAEVRRFIEEFDFNAAIVGINQFVADFNKSLTELNGYISSAKIAAESLKVIYSTIGVGFNAVQAAINTVQLATQDVTRIASAGAAKIGDAFGANTQPIKDFSTSMRDAAVISRDELGKNIAEAVGHFDDLAGVSETAGTTAAEAARVAGAAAEQMAVKTADAVAKLTDLTGVGEALFNSLSSSAENAGVQIESALAAAFAQQKTIEQAKALRDQLAAVFEQMGQDATKVDEAFKKFGDELLKKEDLAKRFSESLSPIRGALGALITDAEGAQQKFNAAISGLFEGVTAEQATMLQVEISRAMLEMGADIDVVERALAGFNAQLEKAGSSKAVTNLTEQFKQLKIQSQAELDETVKKNAAAFDAIADAARKGEIGLSDVRAAFIAYARSQLDAVKNADELKRAQVLAALESKAAAAGLSESLVELGVVGKDAGEKAAKAVKSIAPAADDATKSAQNLSGALAGAGSSATAAAGAIQGNTSALVTNSGAAQDNAYYVGETSKALADQFRQASFSAEGINQLNRVLLQQNQEAARYVELLREQIALTDPVEQSLERLRNKFRGLGDETLRTIAQLEQQRDRARGTEAGGNAPETTTTTTTGGAAPGRSTVVVNLSLSALDPAQLDAATLNDFARKLTGPLRQFALSSS